jgi:hypothetical protein
MGEDYIGEQGKTIDTGRSNVLCVRSIRGTGKVTSTTDPSRILRVLAKYDHIRGFGKITIPQPQVHRELCGQEDETACRALVASLPRCCEVSIDRDAVEEGGFSGRYHEGRNTVNFDSKRLFDMSNLLITRKLLKLVPQSIY